MERAVRIWTRTTVALVGLRLSPALKGGKGGREGGGGEGDGGGGEGGKPYHTQCLFSALSVRNHTSTECQVL